MSNAGRLISDDEITALEQATRYTLTKDNTDGHILKLTPIDRPGQGVQTVTTEDTTYTLTQSQSDGHILTFDGSDNSSVTITIPDNNTTYTLTQDSNNKSKLTLTGTDGYTKTVTLPNTTYTLTQDSNDGHKFTLTGTDGYTATITIPDNDTKYDLQTVIIEDDLYHYASSTGHKKIKINGKVTYPNGTESTDHIETTFTDHLYSLALDPNDATTLIFTDITEEAESQSYSPVSITGLMTSTERTKLSRLNTQKKSGTSSTRFTGGIFDERMVEISNISAGTWLVIFNVLIEQNSGQSRICLCSNQDLTKPLDNDVSFESYQYSYNTKCSHTITGIYTFDGTESIIAVGGTTDSNILYTYSYQLIRLY